jgi:hypothetical protein
LTILVLFTLRGIHLLPENTLWFYQALRRLEERCWTSRPWDGFGITDRQNGKEGVEESESIDVIWPLSIVLYTAAWVVKILHVM